MKQFFLHRHFSAPLSATSVELLNAGPETLNMLLALRSQAAVTDREDRLTMEDGVNRRDFWGVSSQTRISSALDTHLSPCHELPQRTVSPSPSSPARVGNGATIRTRRGVQCTSNLSGEAAFSGFLRVLDARGGPTSSVTTLETTLVQMTPPTTGYPLRMPPESGGIPGRVHFWEVPFALMLSPGWWTSTLHTMLATP